MYILGIESSCDDTCAAVVKDGRELVSNCVASSAAEQNLYGGVVPEIASRRHIEHISQVARAALDEAGTALDEIGGVAEICSMWRSPLRPGSSARCWWA